ncbi:hypothetical protein ACIBBE_23820 [Streptomyces sp. NPDC051644]|uniref:hypothetical protein n=1 Tax=Streptomyces sp. NPDC051644 TaxID=3365666 RepID=UPI00379F2201
MVRTLDRTTVRGKRDAIVMLVAWWMAAPAAEPARLNLHDAEITTVKLEDARSHVRERRSWATFAERTRVSSVTASQAVSSPSDLPEAPAVTNPPADPE